MKGSGTCNVCAAPCSSCMHLSQGTSFMESKAEGGGYSENSCGRRETDASLFSDAETPTHHKSRDDQVPSASEASVDMPFRASPSKNYEEGQLLTKNSGGSPFISTPMSSSMLQRLSLSSEGHNGSESNADDVSCLTVRIADDLIKGDMPCTSASALCSGSLETSSLAKAAGGIEEIIMPTEEPPTEVEMKNEDKDQDRSCRQSKYDIRVKNEGAEDDGRIVTESSGRGNLDAGMPKGQLGKRSQSDGKSNGNDSLLSVQQRSDEECSVLENLEDDVKVCDICGDAGREDLLAICSRCSDGAEHTYCMRVMLDKLPGGDWLCEECSMKDTALSEAVKPETPVISSKEQRHEKNLKREPSICKKSSSVGGVSLLDSESVLPTVELKVLETSGKKTLAKPELTAQLSIQLSETGRKSVLSREGSSKSLDSGKVKPLINSQFPLASHLSSEPVVSRSPEPSSSSSKSAAQQSQPSRGLLSRSCSISGLKSKVKPLIESVILKPQQGTKEYATSDLKEEVHKTLSKSLSLKSTVPRPLNYTESISKSQSSTLHRLEEPRNQKQKKEKLPERSNSYVQNRSLSTSPLSSLSSIPTKTSAVQPDGGKVSGTLEQNVSSSKNGSENLCDKGLKESKKQPPSKSISNVAVSEGSSQATGKEDVKTEKFKECSTSSNSRPLVPPPRRVIRCQKCNETGHSTQFCSIDKIRVSALKPTLERNPKEATIKVNKWRDAVDVAISKDRLQKSSVDRLTDTSQTPTPSSASFLKHEASSVKQSTPICKTGEQDFNSISVQGEDQKQITSILDASRISALPEHEFIWEGCFELNRSGGLPEICEGFQAHLSSRASPKVLEVANKFPGNVQLEEVNRLISWPSQFRDKGPTEENIALFFFAKDIKSYEKGYKKLLETMLKNDLALKGDFDGVELLVFPSNILPLKSQRWNRLFFLWGVLRERRSSPPQAQRPAGRDPYVFDLESKQEPLTKASPLNAETMSTSEEPSINGITEGSPQPSLPAGRSQPVLNLDLEQQPHAETSLEVSLEVPLGHTVADESPKIPSPLSACSPLLTSEALSGDGRANESAALVSTAQETPLAERNLPMFNLDLERQPLAEASSLDPEPAVLASEDQLVNALANGSSEVGSMPGNRSPPTVGRESPLFDLDLEKQPLADASSPDPNPAASTSAEQSLSTVQVLSRSNPSQMKDGPLSCDIQSMGRTNRSPSRNIPSQMEGGGSCSRGLGRSNPWPPDLNLESQDLDDGEETLGSNSNSGGPKRARSYSPIPWRQQAAESSSTSLDGEGGDRKRSRQPFWDVNSSKVHPLLMSFHDNVRRQNALELHFFPLRSNDAEVQPQEELPDLELALGAERKRKARKDVLPFPFVPPPVNPKRPNRSGGEDDESASLSLSLASPFSGKEPQPPPSSAKQASFFLFDRVSHG